MRRKVDDNTGVVNGSILGLFCSQGVVSNHDESNDGLLAPNWRRRHLNSLLKLLVRHRVLGNTVSLP